MTLLVAENIWGFFILPDSGLRIPVAEVPGA
jgi:hypothetical protein